MPLVFIPSLMRSLTEQQDRVPIEGATLRQVVANLDARFPGVQELLVEDGHVRAGIALAINGVIAPTGLMATVPDEAEVQILPALGGGSGLEPA